MKLIIPFCTHAGSGLSDTERSIKDICSGATLLDGFNIPGTTAQNERDEAGKEVREWIENILKNGQNINNGAKTDRYIPLNNRGYLTYLQSTHARKSWTSI